MVVIYVIKSLRDWNSIIHRFRIEFGPQISQNFPLSADVGWPMSDDRLSVLADPSIMKLMADHWLNLVPIQDPAVAAVSIHSKMATHNSFWILNGDWGCMCAFGDNK